MAKKQESKIAVIYARYSSERQNEQSIEGQLRVINQFAEKEGYNVIDTYIDRAMTGRNDDRPSFQKMISDSSNKAFQYVLVYKLDRFSRNRYDSAVYKKKLRDNGVKVISATENISDSPEGIILESILEGYSEYYSKELAQKIIRGNYESRAKGKFTGGPIIYGYRINEDKRYVINEDEAEIVKWIFVSIINHKQIKDVVSALNEKGILFKGKIWKTNAVSRLLRNEKYTGIARYGEYVFDNIVPQIITEEVFKEAQKELDKHRHKNKAKLVDYKFLLSEKLYCGECGALIHGHTGTSHTGKTYHYYKCKNAVKHECSAKPIKKDELEDFVVKTAMDYILSPDIVEKAAERMVEYFNLLSNNGSEIKILEDMEKEIERKLKNCLNAVANGMANKSIADMISSLEEDKAKVEDSLLKAKNKKKKKITVDQCYQFLISLAFLDISKERNKEILINSLIKKVYLYKDKVKIVFYPTNDVEDRSFDDGNGGKSGGTQNGNGGNTDNNGNIGGSLTTSFCPPKMIGDEPPLGFHNENGFLGLVLDRHPE